jgi:hypothetical protein
VQRPHLLRRIAAGAHLPREVGTVFRAFQILEAAQIKAAFRNII